MAGAEHRSRALWEVADKEHYVKLRRSWPTALTRLPDRLEVFVTVNFTPYELVAAETIEPAEWIQAATAAHRTGWAQTLPLRFGPPGFEIYLRAKFSADGRVQDEHIHRTVLNILLRYTQSPGSAFAAVWYGWASNFPTPSAPTIPLDEPMLLFTGPASLLSDAPHLAWFGERPFGGADAPAFAWPADRAWCVTCGIDEEREFTFGCSSAAATSLIERLPDVVRVVPYRRIVGM